VTGVKVTSVANLGAGLTVTATATCAAGKVLGGGAQVTATAPLQRTALLQSYPSSTTVWTGVGVALAALGAGNTMSVQAFVLCQ
jgi:hypothetical protein